MVSKKEVIDKIVDTVDALPSIPSIALKVISIVKQEDKSISDVIDLIKYDQGITANCLKICNSAYFGRKQRVDSLKDALVILGSKNIVKIVFASSVSEIFSTKHVGYGLRKGELWRHSVATAVASQMLCKHFPDVNENSIFTASLLHDVGKLILDTYILKRVTQVLEKMEQGLTEVEAETHIFGINHADIGAYLASHWLFPDVICDAIQDHHTAIHADINCILVRVSNLIAKIATKSIGGIKMALEQEVVKSLGLEESYIDSIIEAFPQEMQKAIDFLNIG